MIKYNNEERLSVLNELIKDNGLSIITQPTHNVFTILTQHFTAHTIEDIADYIIHYKKFLEMYNYDRTNLFFDMQTRNLSNTRFKAWFEENRKLTEEEEKEAIAQDIQIQKMWDTINKEFEQKLAEDLFDAHFELDDENK